MAHIDATMSYAAREITAAAHVLDPIETRKSAKAYLLKYYWRLEDAQRAVAEHKRALEHEAAVVAGYEDGLAEIRARLDKTPRRVDTLTAPVK